MLHIPTLCYFDTSVSYPQWFLRIKFVLIPPRFVQQQYLWNIVIQLAVGCYNSWAYARCSDCSSLGEISLWNGTVTLMMLADALTTSLTHWGRVAHICVGNLGIIDLGNGLSPGRRQAIIWTNAEILLIGPMGTNFNVSLFEIHAFPFTFHLKMSSGKLRPFCVSLVFIHMAV